MTGFVYLVGAGPGDPRLLTVRAHELLRAAEVVAHDELVSPAILAVAPADAERVAVGRRAGHGATPYRLHPAVLEHARAGRHVVRLKCGDPLVFGRGGEEAEELAAAGIEFEIVPGISAALGAAAYAGIPLTHRDCASSVTLATGRTAGAPRGETLVVYMAARRVAACLAELRDAGWPATTPAAWIAAATTPSQQVVTGTIDDLAARVADTGAPALLVVGEVVARRAAWWERRPLAGRRVVVARARPGRSRIASRLRALGAEVIEAPTIEITPLPGVSFDALGSAAAIAFGCASGVDTVVAAGALPRSPIVSIGDEATRALARHGVTPALALAGACRDALAPAVDLLRGRVVVVTAATGRPALLDELAALGIHAEALPAYRTSARLQWFDRPVDLIVLPSSSAARLILRGAPDLCEVPAIAIGARTEAAARALGVHRVLRADRDSIDAVVDGAARFV